MQSHDYSMEETTYKVIAPYYGLKVGDELYNSGHPKLIDCFRNFTIQCPRRSKEMSELEDFAGCFFPEQDSFYGETQRHKLFLDYLYRKNVIEKVQRWNGAIEEIIRRKHAKE